MWTASLAHAAGAERRFQLDLVFHAIRSFTEDALSFGLSFSFKHRVQLLCNKTMMMSLPGVGSLNIRPGTSDMNVVRQVFRQQEYDISTLPQNKKVDQRYEELCANGQVPVIIDAGANIGASSIWFASKYPKAKILAVEPDPENAACCRTNTRTFENIAVVEAGIGSSSGGLMLVNPSGASWAVQTERCAEGGDVRICTVQELSASVPHGRLFIVKIDIEGFESDLFSANTSWIDDTMVIVIEPHDWLLPGQKSSRSFQKALAERDFDLVLSGENLIYFNL